MSLPDSATPAPAFIHLPGTDGYERGRIAWNLTVRQSPAAVAIPADADECAAAVRYAREHGLRVAPQATGHAALPLAARPLDDVLLVRTHAMRGIAVDDATGVVRVGAGALTLEAVTVAEEHRLLLRHGSATDVSVVGLATGGGLGPYGRARGLMSEQITAAELVTADGRIERVDDETDPDAMWALRGGRANIGLVTALELRGDPAGDLTAGMLLWDASHARDVLRAWAAWAPGAPDAITTSWRVLRFPPLPELPPFLAGRAVVVVDGAVLGTEDEAALALAPLRSLGPGLEPELDTFAPMAPSGVPHVHMDPPQPAPALSFMAQLGALPDEAIEAVLAHGGPGVDTPLLTIELRQLGGALARPTGRGCVDHVPGEFLAFAAGFTPSPEAAAAVTAAGRAVVDALASWSLDERYLNFADEVVDPARGYTPDAYERLRRIRRERDPERVFVANHAVR